MAAPSYHDVHVTTATIKRTSLFNLPYRLQLKCTRATGWQLWALEEGDLPEELLGGEYDERGIRIDVAGVIICDSLVLEPGDCDGHGQD